MFLFLFFSHTFFLTLFNFSFVSFHWFVARARSPGVGRFLDFCSSPRIIFWSSSKVKVSSQYHSRKGQRKRGQYDERQKDNIHMNLKCYLPCPEVHHSPQSMLPSQVAYPWSTDCVHLMAVSYLFFLSCCFIVIFFAFVPIGPLCPV